MIDCLLIGHNDPDFVEYEAAIRRLGEESAIYRDLKLNFAYYDGTPTTFSQLYNRMRDTSTPFGVGSILSPAVVYLANYVRRRGFSYDWVNSFQEEKDILASKLRQDDVRVVAITTTYYMSPSPVIEIVEFVRDHNHKCAIVVGGPYIYSLYLSRAHDHLFSRMGADYYVISPQGELALSRLLTALRSGRTGRGIPNVAYRAGPDFEIDAMETEVTDLQSDPVEWRPFGGYIGKVASIRTAVSCPFSCSFCGFPTRGGRYRTTSISSVERELDDLAQIDEIEAVQFVDDTFNVPPRRFKEMLRMLIRRNYGYKWNCQFRCQYADRETVELMKESGCEGVFLGIESANDAVLENMNKSVSVHDYYRGLDLLNEVGITSHANFIIGFPGETDESYEDIKTFLREARPTFFRCQLWYCDPTTPIWHEREKYGVRGRGFTWSHPTMDAEEASARVQEMFLTWDETTWTPQYNFEFYGVCQLMHEGMSLEDVHQALRAFNRGVRQHLLNGDRANISNPNLAAMRTSIDRRGQ
jgi:anaerobic magnesium-protoporphyrin IX monomethyl ester cyclase